MPCCRPRRLCLVRCSRAMLPETRTLAPPSFRDSDTPAGRVVPVRHDCIILDRVPALGDRERVPHGPNGILWSRVVTGEDAPTVIEATAGTVVGEIGGFQDRACETSLMDHGDDHPRTAKTYLLGLAIHSKAILARGPRRPFPLPRRLRYRRL